MNADLGFFFWWKQGLFKDVADVPLFKEHVAVGQDYECGCDNDDYGFNAFGVLRHGDFFLHEVYEQVEDNACKHAASVLDINPCRDESHWCNRNQEVEHVKHVHLPYLIVVGSGNPEERKMPQRPDKSKDD